MSKYFALFLISFCFAVAAHAEDFGNIKQGNVSVGGSFQLTESGGSTTLLFSPNAEYFLADHFSLGAQGNLFTTSGYSSWGLGPSATYYFLVSDHWAPFANLSAVYNRGGNSGYYYTQYTAQAGAKYFFTPSVALGGSLAYALTTDNTNTAGGALSLLGAFYIFL